MSKIDGAIFNFFLYLGLLNKSTIKYLQFKVCLCNTLFFSLNFMRFYMIFVKEKKSSVARILGLLGAHEAECGYYYIISSLLKSDPINLNVLLKSML